MATVNTLTIETLNLSIDVDGRGAISGLSNIERQSERTANRIGRLSKSLGFLRSGILVTIKALLSMGAVIIAYNLLVSGPQKAFQLLAGAISSAATAVFDFQEATLQLQGILATTQKFSNDFATSFKIAGDVAAAMIDQLQRRSREIIASSEDVLLVIQTINSTGGAAIFRTQQEVLDASILLSNAIVSITRGQERQRQLAEETRSLFTQQLRSTSLLGRLIFDNTEQMKKFFREAEKSQNGLDLLRAKLRGFAEVAERVGSTFTGLVTTTQDLFSRFARTAFTDVFDELRLGYVALIARIFGAEEAFNRLAAAVGDVFRVFVERGLRFVGEVFKNDTLKNVIDNIQAIRQAAIEGNITIEEAAAQYESATGTLADVFKSLPEIVGELVGKTPAESIVDAIIRKIDELVEAAIGKLVLLGTFAEAIGRAAVGVFKIISAVIGILGELVRIIGPILAYVAQAFANLVDGLLELLDFKIPLGLGARAQLVSREKLSEARISLESLVDTLGGAGEKIAPLARDLDLAVEGLADIFFALSEAFSEKESTESTEPGFFKRALDEVRKLREITEKGFIDLSTTPTSGKDRPFDPTELLEETENILKLSRQFNRQVDRNLRLLITGLERGGINIREAAIHLFDAVDQLTRRRIELGGDPNAVREDFDTNEDFINARIGKRGELVRAQLRAERFGTPEDVAKIKEQLEAVDSELSSIDLRLVSVNDSFARLADINFDSLTEILTRPVFGEALKQVFESTRESLGNLKVSLKDIATTFKETFQNSLIPIALAFGDALVDAFSGDKKLGEAVKEFAANLLKTLGEMAVKLGAIFILIGLLTFDFATVGKGAALVAAGGAAIALANAIKGGGGAGASASAGREEPTPFSFEQSNVQVQQLAQSTQQLGEAATKLASAASRLEGISPDKVVTMSSNRSFAAKANLALADSSSAVPRRSLASTLLGR